MKELAERPSQKERGRYDALQNPHLGFLITDHYSYFIEWAQEMKKVLVRPAIAHLVDKS